MQPKIYHIGDHEIDPSLIDADAIYVIHRLRQAGYETYLVGGSVRDLLIKKKPKDFDISTSAKPEEIKQVFGRSCLLIGRRFRLAHLRFGHKIIEVATFRSGENDSDLIVHDNLWGSAEEDVIRRDFTINGLYYDPETHTVIDYAGGWKDIQQRVLRTIGDPISRFKQDPVRMIRLLKFQARFGFIVEEQTQQALLKCQEEIIKSSSARILEEMLRMLESGAAAPFFRLMTTSGLLEPLFPALNYFLEGKHSDIMYSYLTAIDSIHQHENKKTINRSILTACLVYPILEQEIRSKYRSLQPTFAQIVTLASSVIHGIIDSSFSRFPKRMTMEAHYILATQYRLTPLGEKKPPHTKAIHNREFDLALNFLKIRSIVDEKLIETYHWWQRIYQQTGREEERHGHSSHPRGPRKRKILIENEEHQEEIENEIEGTE